jgi:hypothetical protein
MYSFKIFFSFPGSSVCDCLSSSSQFSILLSIFCNIDLVDMNYFNLFFSWKVFIPPLKLEDNFVGYSWLD